MTGVLEGMAAVATITSFFVSGRKIVSENRRKREMRQVAVDSAVQKAELRLSKTLEDGLRKIEDEQSRNLSKLGLLFRNSDGMSNQV
jgi:hypothetical protein